MSQIHFRYRCHVVENNDVGCRNRMKQNDMEKSLGPQAELSSLLTALDQLSAPPTPEPKRSRTGGFHGRWECLISHYKVIQGFPCFHGATPSHHTFQIGIFPYKPYIWGIPPFMETTISAGLNVRPSKTLAPSQTQLNYENYSKYQEIESPEKFRQIPASYSTY